MPHHPEESGFPGSALKSKLNRPSLCGCLSPSPKGGGLLQHPPRGTGREDRHNTRNLGTQMRWPFPECATSQYLGAEACGLENAPEAEAGSSALVASEPSPGSSPPTRLVLPGPAPPVALLSPATSFSFPFSSWVGPWCLILAAFGGVQASPPALPSPSLTHLGLPPGTLPREFTSAGGAPGVAVRVPKLTFLPLLSGPLCEVLLALWLSPLHPSSLPRNPGPLIIASSSQSPLGHATPCPAEPL